MDLLIISSLEESKRKHLFSITVLLVTDRLYSIAVFLVPDRDIAQERVAVFCDGGPISKSGHFLWYVFSTKWHYSPCGISIWKTGIGTRVFSPISSILHCPCQCTITPYSYPSIGHLCCELSSASSNKKETIQAVPCLGRTILKFYSRKEFSIRYVLG
jgi:hypothetical protein